jgi:vitamin B12 transporter
MSKKNLLICVAVCTGCTILRAQDSPRVRALDEVVVTATKYPVKQNQTGKLVIIIDKEALDQSSGKTLAEILNEQAGLIVNGALNNLGTNPDIYLRGAPSGRTLISIDGIPVSDPSGIDNGFNINLIPLDQVERIEICKGAQSTLYGSDAIAGVINIITVGTDLKKPLNLKATLAGGNEASFRGNLQAFGRYRTLGYSLSYSRLSTRGFPSAYDSSGKGNFTRDGYQGDAVSSRISWDPLTRLRFHGIVRYSRYMTGLPSGAFTDARNYTLTSPNLMLGGGFQYKTPMVSITGNYLYNTIDRLSLQDSTGQSDYLRDHFFGKTQFVELYANTDLGGGFVLLNGADYRFASMNEQYLSVSSFGPYSSQMDDTSMSQTSMYSSLFYSGKSGINAEIGGRLNTHSRYGSNYTYSFNPSYRVGTNWKFYASIASGFKAPSLYQLYSAYGDPELQPEKSVNYEAGLQFNNPAVNMRLTYFYRKISEGIDFDYNAFRYFNYDGQRASGIEWETSVRIGNRVSLALNYTFTQVKEQSQSRVSFEDTTYSYALRQPEHALNITLALRPGDNLFFSLSGHYESRRYDIGGHQVPDVPLNRFFILNAYAEYAPAPWLKCFVDGKNLANTKFFTIYGYNSIPFLIQGGLMVHL